jgi:hypothetical protein
LRGDEEERQVRQRPHDHAELVAQRLVGPVQVVDHEHREAPHRLAAHHVGERDLDGVAGAGGVEAVERRRVPEEMGDGVEVATDGPVVGLQPPQLLGAPGDRRGELVGRGVDVDAEEGGEPGDDRRPHIEVAVGRARGAHDDRLALERGHDLVGEARLARPCLADDRHDAAVAAAHELHRGVEHRTLVDPADERHVAAQRAGAGGVGAGDQPRLLVLVPAAQPGDAERFAADRRWAQRDGGRTREHPTGRRQGLQARRGVHDVAHRRVVGAGEDPHQHLAGVEADAHLDRPVEAGLADDARERVLHPQRGPRRALGVVLVGDGRTEQGDDGVTEQLVDTAAERLDVGDEPFEARVDEALHALGVEVLGERGVADEVGEQHRDDAPLLERAIGLRDRAPARRTEPCPLRHRMAAHPTRHHPHCTEPTAGVRRRVASSRPHGAGATSARRRTRVHRRADARHRGAG